MKFPMMDSQFSSCEEVLSTTLDPPENFSISSAINEFLHNFEYVWETEDSLDSLNGESLESFSPVSKRIKYEQEHMPAESHSSNFSQVFRKQPHEKSSNHEFLSLDHISPYKLKETNMLQGKKVWNQLSHFSSVQSSKKIEHMHTLSPKVLKGDTYSSPKRKDKKRKSENEPGRPEDPIKWHTRYRELMAFKEKHGHCNVPAKEKPLGIWVMNQRARFKQGKLSEDRINKLRALQFRF